MFSRLWKYVSAGDRPVVLQQVNLPLDLSGPVSTHMCQIDAEEGAVRGKGGHGESTIAYEITFSDLDHATKLCNTLPL